MMAMPQMMGRSACIHSTSGVRMQERVFVLYTHPQDCSFQNCTQTASESRLSGAFLCTRARRIVSDAGVRFDTHIFLVCS